MSAIILMNGLIKQWGKVEKGSDMAPLTDWKFRIDGLLFRNDYSLFFNIEALVATGGPEYTYKRDGGSCECNLTNRNGGVNLIKPIVRWFAIGF